MTHTFPRRRQRAECARRINMCAFVTGRHLCGNKEKTSFLETKIFLLFSTSTLAAEAERAQPGTAYGLLTSDLCERPHSSVC